MTHWSTPLVGLPYAEKGRDPTGVDCWGVVCLALAAAGFTVPSYGGEYVSTDENREIDAAVAREAVSPLWRPVEPGSECEFDVLIFRRGRYASHAGVVVKPGLMLHIEQDDMQSRVVDYRAPLYATRLSGIYRWHEIA